MDDPARSTRLKWSKRAEYELKKELNQIARKECNDKIRNFAECAKTQGLMVIFR